MDQSKFMYEGFGLSYPVFEDDGEIVGTIPGVAGELGITSNAVYQIIFRHKDLIGEIRSLTNCKTSDLLRQNKERFGFKRLKSDIKVLTRRQMRIISMHARSKKATEFQLRLDDVMEAHWKLTSVSSEVFEEEHALRIEAEERATKAESQIEQLVGEVHQLDERLSIVEGARSEAASAAGRGLRAQRGIN
jgi:hypothetical protein